MSAIGGMVNWNAEAMDSRPLFEMSRTMMLRAGASRNAYVQKQVALVQNHARGDAYRMPQVLQREGRRCVAVVDGNPSFSSEEELFEGFFEVDAPESILDAYSSFRESLGDLLVGPFALAVADEARAELYLLRDQEGARPLFYREEEGTLYFASEIKALLGAPYSVRMIDADHLRAYLRAPYGVYFGEDLYRNVTALPAGCSAVFSRLGLRVFRNAPRSAAPLPRGVDFSCTELCVPTEGELDRMLTELLYAFDYPQFDYLMPALLCALDDYRTRGMPRELVFEDPSLCMNLRYASERADRIGAMRGVSLTPCAPWRFFAKERELRRLERVLRSLLGSVDSSPLRDLLGERWSEEMVREKNTTKRIRMEGMAYQTLLWEKNFPLLLL